MAVEHIGTPLRVVEFYSGAGGFHCALLDCGTRVEVVASFDINTNANKVYEHNFPHCPHFNRNLCGLTPQELDCLKADVFVLSPPCQPFTRQGLRRDNTDRRTDSFFHLLLILKELVKPPSYILIENVQGFESSNTREHCVKVVEEVGYLYQEFLVTPMQFGIPNSRLRYYLLAKKHPLRFSLKFKELCKDPRSIRELVEVSFQVRDSECLQTSSVTRAKEMEDCLEVYSTALSSPVPPTQTHPQPSAISLEPVCTSTSFTALPASFKPKNEASCYTSPPHIETQTLVCYLQDLSQAELIHYLVPERILTKYATALDIVTSSSTRSCCFTKAYGNYAVGTGSVLQHAVTQDLDKAFEEYIALHRSGETQKCFKCLLSLKLRYFTPKEVANIMCFPPWFSFPPGLSQRQCYKVIGNSLNVHVVSVLLKYLFHEC